MSPPSTNHDDKRQLAVPSDLPPPPGIAVQWSEVLHLTGARGGAVSLSVSGRSDQVCRRPVDQHDKASSPDDKLLHSSASFRVASHIRNTTSASRDRRTVLFLWRSEFPQPFPVRLQLFVRAPAKPVLPSSQPPGRTWVDGTPSVEFSLGKRWRCRQGRLVVFSRLAGCTSWTGEPGRTPLLDKRMDLSGN